MKPEKHAPDQARRGLPDPRPPALELLFDPQINAVLRYEAGKDNESVQEISERISRTIHADPTSYTDLQIGKALAGIARLALGTYDEGAALDNAGRVSGLSRTLGAVVYSLSALYGPADNLYLVSDGLNKIDRNLTASVLAEVARQDPSEYVRTLALQWLAYSAPSEAASLAQELSQSGTLTPDMLERCKRAAATKLANDSSPVSILSPEEQQAVTRILPAIQQIASGKISLYRIKAIDVLAQERPLYAIPMLTIAAQVSTTEVREVAITALSVLDPETANILRETSPSLVNRCVVDHGTEDL